MPDYLKIQNDITYIFRPTTTNSKETFALWDVKGKNFIREGGKVSTEKGEQDVNKYIKLSDLEKKEKYGRSPKFEFIVEVDGTEMIMSIPPGATGELEKQFDTIRNLKGDPTKYLYSISRARGANKIIKYEVKLEKKIDDVEDEKLDIDLSVSPSDSEMDKMTETELKYITALKSNPAAKDFTNAERMSVLVENAKITKERAEELVAKNF